MNTELLEEKYNYLQTLYILNNVMKKYDTYDRNLLKEILKYNTLCSCGSNTFRKIRNNKVICYRCGELYKTIKNSTDEYNDLISNICESIAIIICFIILVVFVFAIIGILDKLAS
jgi:hypothetical protein